MVKHDSVHYGLKTTHEVELNKFKEELRGMET